LPKLLRRIGTPLTPENTNAPGSGPRTRTCAAAEPE
jgi:hypothetical protein